MCTIKKIFTEILHHQNIINILIPYYVVIVCDISVWVYSVDSVHTFSQYYIKKYIRDNNVPIGAPVSSEIDPDVFIADLWAYINNNDYQLFIGNRNYGKHSESWEILDASL